ncbi:MAG: response regulator [Candidatus Melainabacteria bacterium HGW-Melainabacteria-1]|nr:MAG: response regulator [Candidatus Melainabacteria bacterium HGW-Melainabacteria-1]
MTLILVAEDDPTSLAVTQNALVQWGYAVQLAKDGELAWKLLQAELPELVILDWKMPGFSGLELCAKIRADERLKGLYVIMLTASSGRENMLEALAAGADDYLEKPLDPALLKARLQVAERILLLQKILQGKITELQEALTNVRELRGLLPICSYCKKIRNDENYWERLESYLCSHTHAQFSHSICPDCYESVVRKELESFKRDTRDTQDP